MKNYIIVISIMIVALVACKKTTYNYTDGFDSGLDSTKLLVDTSLKTINVSKYAQARVFPGLVCTEEPRITTTVNMRLSYNAVGQNLRISVPPRPQFSTGLYAAPGELVIVDVPSNMYSLTLQVGAWTDNLTALAATKPINRDPLIYSRTQLAPGRNYVRNLYGGNIYIIPNVSLPNPIDLVFTNVCKSPDFVLGETTNSQWKDMITKSCVPFLELRGKSMILTVPRQYCISHPITNPEELMKEWDLCMDEDFYGWMGLSANPTDPIDLAPLLPYRIVLDPNPSVGYGHSGFPIVATNDINWFKFSTDINVLRKSKPWGTYHEIGHNTQQSYWSWSTLGETTNNLFIYKLAKRNSLKDPSAWPALHDINAAADQYEDLSARFATAITFSSEINATKNFDGSDARIDNSFNRLTPFVQLFEKIPANWDGNGQPDGWGFFPYLYSQARRGVRVPVGDLGKHDFFYETLSNYTKHDMHLFFNAWGIQLSELAKNRIAAKGYPTLVREWWKYNPVTKTGGNTLAASVIAFSSQATNEPAPSGLATAAIDENTSTYWHTSWSPRADPPHFLTIDYFARRSIKGFRLMNRPSGSGVTGAIRNLTFEVSDNNSTWTQVSGSPFAMQAVQGYQTVSFAAPVQARYVRLRVPATANIWNGQYFVCINEFSIIE